MDYVEELLYWLPQDSREDQGAGLEWVAEVISVLRDRISQEDAFRLMERRRELREGRG